MKLNTKVNIWFAVSLMVGLLATAGYACVGARPLGMGGAFVGLADDVNASYWNPAGLIQIEGLQATWMHTMTNRDRINYQDYVAVAATSGEKKPGQLAGALSFIQLNTQGADTESLVWGSLAYRVNENSAVGLNIRMTSHSLSGLTTDTGLDLAYFSRPNRQWSYGLLIQDANETKRKLYGAPFGKMIRNWRPGIAFRPDDSQVISAELYDAAGEIDTSLRVGYERTLENGMAVRGGIYGLGSDASAFTLGVGGGLPMGQQDRPFSLRYDAAIMFGDIDTLLASITFAQ